MDFFLASNLSPASTGLPFVVWISVQPDDCHDPCVWVSKSGRPSPSEFVKVAIRPDVRLVDGNISESDFDLLRRWIELNRSVIEGHRSGETPFSEDAIDRIRRLET